MAIEHPDAFTVTDEMIASLLAEPVPGQAAAQAATASARSRRHGFAAMATFFLAVVAAPSARRPRLGVGPPVRQAGSMAEKLTMMAVHAHPDDEASSTGGVLAAYSAQGIRTVVVTCTNGEFGDAPAASSRGRTGTTSRRWPSSAWLSCASPCAILGVTDLELLGYHDSGMPEWDYKDRPDAFCNIPQAEVAARI